MQQHGESIKDCSMRVQAAAQTYSIRDFLVKEKETVVLKYQKWVLKDQLADKFVISLKSEKNQNRFNQQRS